MRHNPWRFTPAALGVLILTSCADDLTQPDTADQQPAALATALAPDTWIKRTPDPVERIATVLADVPNAAGQSVLYVIGGWLRGISAQGLKVVEAYNVATDTWARKRDLPIGLSYINGAGVIGGKIYIAGGDRQTYGWTTYAVFVYDPAKDTWTRLAGMPVRGGNGVLGVIGDKLYVEEPADAKYWWPSPGTLGDQAPRHFFRYDPATDKWTTLPSPAHAYFMGGVLYGKLYLVGNQTEAYDPATNKWTVKSPPPSGKYDIWGSAAAVQAKLYVFGEGTGKTLVYAPLIDRWTVRPNPAVGAGIAPVAARVFVDGRPRIQVLSEGMNYQYVP
jgi:N-acetylneuraminic acid mutarotase